MSVEISITDQIVEINEVSNPVEISVSAGAAVAQWGSITGTLSNQTDLQNALNLKVPYTGATANVDLGEFELKAGQIEYDQTPTGVAGVAVTRWNDSTGTIETTLKGGSVVLEHGRDMFERVVNKTGIQLTKAAYQAVRVSNAQGQRLAVQLAQANNDNNSADTIGLVVETIDDNQEGYIYTVGEIDGVNTTGTLQGETWVDGDVLYLSPTTAGRITNIKPLAPQHLVIIGYVIYAHQNNGKIYIKITNGFELGELHDVSTIGAVAGNVLKYNGTIWTPSGDVGITSLNGLTATTQTFSLDTRGNDVAIVSSGSNHEFIFPSASATRRGVLTSADWSLFFNKIGGSGTIGTMPIFTGTGAIGNSIVNITNGLVNIDGVGNLSDYALQIGTGRTNNGFAYIDLVGDATYSDYGFRLMRNNTGANATSVLEHRGTGDFIFKTVDNANLYLQTGSTNRVFVEANSGALNVANTSAVFLANTGEQLIVNGSGKFASSVTANSLVKTGGTSSQYLMADGSTSTLTNPITGTGNTNYLPKFTGASTLGNSILREGTDVISLGIAPSAWSILKAFQNQRSTFSSYTDGIFASTQISTNAYYDGSWRYIASFGAARYDQQSNNQAHFWSTAAAGTAGNAITFTQAMTLFNTGNLALNSTTDSGQRLQVYGDTLLKGSGNTSATTALNVQDSAGSSILRARGDGAILIGASASAPIIQAFEGITGPRSLRISLQAAGSLLPIPSFNINQSDNFTYTSGTGEFTTITANFLPTSGTGTLASLVIRNTINQTGGANGITRGLYVNPTLTSAADWRSIEWSNNTGWGLRGEGTADNYLGGRLSIGTTSQSQGLRIGRNPTTASSTSILVNVAIQNTVTTAYQGYLTSIGLNAAGFTLPNLSHFEAVNDGTHTAGVVTNLYGFRENLGTYSATNVFGFYGNIPAATGRWNFYANGTALNYMNGALLLGSTTSTGEQLQVTGTARITDVVTGSITARSSALQYVTAGSTNINQHLFTTTSSQNGTSGDTFLINSSSTFNPTSGTATYSNLRIVPVINQTGGANGITRGLFVNPTLTAAADWRSVEMSNNSGWGIYQTGASANNYFAGDIGLGTTSVTNWLNIGAGTTAKAQINLAASTAPTTPANGDIWFDGTDLKMRIGGVTKTFTLV